MEVNLLHTNISYLKGVGPKKAEILAKELKVYTFGKVGSFLGLDQLFTKYSTSSSSGGSTIGSYNALDDIREKNTIEKNSVWRRDGI